MIHEEIIKKLSDSELKECYLVIKDYDKTGIMGDTLVRRIRNEIAKEYGDNFDSNCLSVVIPTILLEIAERYYDNN